ncbi:MAG TPA: hypothetical protein VLX28_21415 [Thermoanaerobaculia bacterium]|nr:hypothetical protein [Thermoanaerobaculia bacterium]
MRRKVGFFTALLLVGLALRSLPASATLFCMRTCSKQFQACYNACNGDPDCQATCGDNQETCFCQECGICN